MLLGVTELPQAGGELALLEPSRRALRDDARAVRSHNAAVVAPVAVVEKNHLLIGNPRGLAEKWKMSLGLIRPERHGERVSKS